MRKEIKRILFVVFFLGCFLLFQNINFVDAKDADFPTKTIEFLISAGAGGSNDIAYRALNKAASMALGQPIVTINKPGANGAMAYKIVKNAAPDGYTLGNVSGNSFLMPFLEEPPYNSPKDFTWIMAIGRLVYVVMVQNDAPWKNWNEFISWAKKNPRAAKIGVNGSKAVDFKALNMWQAGRKENAEFTFIVLKSSAETLTALLGGHINVYAMAVDTSTMSYVKEGKLRILAFISEQKIAGYENIPSIEEMYGVGYPNFLGIGGPKGMPEPVVKRLADVYSKAMKDPEFIQVMNRMTMPIWYLDRIAVTKYAEERFAETAKIVEKVKAEEEKKPK